MAAALLLPAITMAAEAVGDRIVSFDIPRLRADKALIEFAEQADVTFIFPVEEARKVSANAVRGELTPQAAIYKLLAGTGLQPQVQLNGALTVNAEETLADKGDIVKKRGLFASIVAVLTANTATDVQADQESDSVRLQEIIVTAQRRETALQDLPVSVRALDGEELKRLGAVNIEDYAGVVPSVTLIQQGGPGRTQIEMRGVTVGNMRDDRPEFRPTVGIYLDESPIAAQTVNANIALTDLERIEVMRGPQATLYGAGSLSGTIRMIPRKPELAESSGRVGAIGSYTENGGGNFGVNGMVNIPLIKDELALRAVGFYRDDTGYIDNPVLRTENVNDYRDIGGRLSLRYEPTEYFRLDGSIAYQDTKTDSMFEFYEEAGDLNTQNAIPTPQDAKLIVASVVADVDVGVGTLTSATSYFGNSTDFYQDGSLFTDFITGTVFVGEKDQFPGPLFTFFDLDEFTQELRFVSSDEGRVTWIAGLLFQQQNHGFGQELNIPGIDAVSGIPSTDYLAEPDHIYTSDIENETSQFSVFGEASTEISDRLTLKAGLRWFYATQNSTVFFAGPLAFPNIGTESAKNSEDGINPSFNVAYQIDDDRMLYLQAARGFRLGGVNQPIAEILCAEDLIEAGLTEPPKTFDADSLWNYEAGLKSSWLGDRLRVNASGYYIDWQDPAYVVSFACGMSMIINAGEFDIFGFEMDVEAVLAKGLISRLGFAYTKSELGEDVPIINAEKGEETPYTPEFTASFSLDYDFPVTFLSAGGMAFIHGNVRWVDDRLTRFASDPRESTGWGGLFNLESYTEGNLRAGLYSDAWRVELFIQNVADERPELSKRTWPYSEFPGTPIVTLRPRTFGVEISRQF